VKPKPCTAAVRKHLATGSKKLTPSTYIVPPLKFRKTELVSKASSGGKFLPDEDSPFTWMSGPELDPTHVSAVPTERIWVLMASLFSRCLTEELRPCG